MIRATEVLPNGHWDRASETDVIELPHDGRHRRRIAMRGEKDTVFMLDLAEAATLRDGDGLKLQDGRVVRVIAAVELVAEITAREPRDLVRIAWHLGSRHVPVQVFADRIRVGRDEALAELVAGLGGEVSHLEAPFDPEGSAEAAHAHGHHTHHHHDHDHAHGENCGCGHDHSHEHGHSHKG